MSVVETKVEGLPAVTAKIKQLNQALNVEAILDESAAILLNRIKVRFLDQKDADGNKWPVSRAAIKRALSGRGGGTLYDTGTLWRSIQLYAVGKNSRAIGTDVDYGRKHQEGLDGMIKREFLGFNDGDVDLVQRLVIKRLTEAMT